MIDERELVERAVRALVRQEPAFDELIKRRDRKRRNQRITAGVVGIAVFVAAVWIVTSVKSLDRTEKSIVPATSGTTGPAETGPTGPPDATWDGIGIPPEGTRLSTPVEGEVLRQARTYTRFLLVYADGRVISATRRGRFILERRLTPEGVARVRSGAIKPWQFLTLPMEVPDDAWAEAEGKPYAPQRYSLCLEGLTAFASPPNLTDPSAADMFPAPAKALLREQDPDPVNPECLVVTTNDARTLDQLLRKAGLAKAPWSGNQSKGWMLRPGVAIDFSPRWPDGESHGGFNKG